MTGDATTSTSSIRYIDHHKDLPWWVQRHHNSGRAGLRIGSKYHSKVDGGDIPMDSDICLSNRRKNWGVDLQRCEQVHEAQAKIFWGAVGSKMLPLLLHVEKHADIDIQQEEAVFVKLRSFSSSCLSVRNEDVFQNFWRQVEELLVGARKMREPWTGMRALDNEHL